MIKKQATSMGGKTFLINMILPNIKSPCKAQPQAREVRMTSQLRLRVLSVLRQLDLPCAVTLAELSKLVNEPEGRTQGALYNLKRNGFVSYEYLNGIEYVITSVVQSEDNRPECPYGFADCKLCIFVSAACRGGMTMEGAHNES